MIHNQHFSNMRPSSKLQVDVISKSKQLTDKDGFIMAWAKKDCLRHIGYATKNRVICMECGERFSTDIVSGAQAVCPHCRTKLEIETSLTRTFKQRIYVGFAQVVGIYQVVRYFEISSYHGDGKKTKYFCYEILQHWIREDGKSETVARIHTLNNYCDSWSGNMEIRKDYNRQYYSHGIKYDVYTDQFHPKSEFRQEYAKYGIDKNLAGLTFMGAKRIVPESPHAETLLKAKQYSLLSHIRSYASNISRHWASIKICMRNNYIVNDAGMWFDYIDLLTYFNHDLRNAHYVCPKDLKLAHDQLVESRRRIQQREKLEKQRRKIVVEQAKFEEQKKNFFGIQFTDGTLVVKTLDSVEEFMKEGDALHHCVFTNEYYKKRDSLIMSARIGDTPIETVEVSLKKMDIVQSRGLCNKSTEYHDQVIKLVRRNLKKIAVRV